MEAGQSTRENVFLRAADRFARALAEIGYAPAVQQRMYQRQSEQEKPSQRAD